MIIEDIGLNFHVTGSNTTMMDDRPTKQRQPENQTASSFTPAGVPMKSDHQHAFLPLNPDYEPPALFPLLEPLQHDDESHNQTRPVNNVNSVKDKDSNTKDGPKKFSGDQKLTQPAQTKTSLPPYQIDDILITTTEASNNRETEAGKEYQSVEKLQHPKHKDVLKTEEKLEPYHVKPPLLPEYEERPLDNSEKPFTWLKQQHKEDKNKHEVTLPNSADGRSPSVRPDKPPLDNPPNHLNPGQYFTSPSRTPVLVPEDIFHVQAVPGSATIQQENSSPEHHSDGPSDPHLAQILMHLQRQGILPDRFTILQDGHPPHEDTLQQQRTEPQEENTKATPENRPVYESDSDDIRIHIPPGRLPPRYIQGIVPKPSPRPSQYPSLYQTGVPRPLLNDPRNILPHPLLPDQYPDQSGRQPDTDGPLVAHVPYQGLLASHQYQGVQHIPPHVDIDHLLLTSQGRHNRSQPGQLFRLCEACSRLSCMRLRRRLETK